MHDRLKRISARIARLFLLLLLIPTFAVVLLKWVDPPTTAFMMEEKLQALWRGDSDTAIRYTWVDYSKISPHLKIAVVAAEDQKFPDHFGFDLESIRKALKSNMRNKRVRGASTISQQVAKNLFLWPGKSFLRKGVEAYLTLAIELTWSKERILEMYLNIAQMGKRTYGAEAASRAYFRKPAAKLNRRQAALLAAVLPNPVGFSVTKPSPYVQRRIGWILKQAGQLGGTKYLNDL